MERRKARVYDTDYTRNCLFDGIIGCNNHRTDPASEYLYHIDRFHSLIDKAITLGLNGTANDAFWTGTSYLLASAVSQPFITNLSDIFGRRDMNLIALAFFTVGTLICCLAQDFTVMLVGRSIQGIGGGGILSLGLVIVTDIIPLRQRPKYYGIIQAAWAIGTISGPLIGGALVENTTWRWVFYITFPFCGIGFILIPLTVKLQTRATSFRHRLLQVDWTGGLLFIAGTTLFLIAITWGGTEFPWGSYQTLVPLILGTVVILISLLWEAYIAKQPVLRVRVFNGISAKAAYICTLAQGTLVSRECYTSHHTNRGVAIRRTILLSLLSRFSQG